MQTLQKLSTPALVLDLDVFEANLDRLTQTLAGRSCGFRPHAKTHKCPELAERQRAAGALGVSVATVPEAEAMVAAGLSGVLLTSPVVTPEKIARVSALAGTDPELMAAVDHPRTIDAFDEAARAAGVTLGVLLDIDVGDHRTGTQPGKPALDLARRVTARRNLRLRGLQAYYGGASHVVGFEARAKRSQTGMGKAVATRRLLEKNGIEVEILSGGSTGTYNIDSALDGVTELQAGSFVFMDLDYRRIGGESGERYTDFGHALTVLSTVVSVTHRKHVSIDAGVKAFSTDVPYRPEPVGLAGVRYTIGGDEFGILRLDDPSHPVELGDKIRFLVPHCDPTVNLYDRIHCVRGEDVVDTWPVVARGQP